jgi:hypothetical protein
MYLNITHYVSGMDSVPIFFQNNCHYMMIIYTVTKAGLTSN